ncbi:viral A-type inclusion protein [Reticulomyxa filosa]|uniref:Viral A-type inclusion protein n=1 Tax=Reticulomyxa filosa TaxID=46433 RepID=X6LUY6_RETFI|nr:viral A-type inclusion protein [Reticulomyxa filosa]|eukprot:ETO05409.1 viral A-type inclusion protein [Reticulomyxa filosa]
MDYTETVSSNWFFSKTIKLKKSFSVIHLYLVDEFIYAWTDAKEGVWVEQLKVRNYIVVPDYASALINSVKSKQDFFFFISYTSESVTLEWRICAQQNENRERLKLLQSLEEERQTIQDLQNKLANLENKNKQLQKHIDTVTEQNESLADKNLKLDNENADLSEKLDQVKAIIKKNNTEIGSLTAALNKSENEKKEQIKQANSWKEKYNERMNHIESLKKENNKQIQQINDHKGEIEQHLKQINILKTQINNSDKDNKQQMRQIDTLKDEKQQLTKDNAQLTREKEAQKEELDRRETKIRKLESDYQQQKTQLDTTKTKLHEHVTLNEKNRSALSSLHSEKDILINEMETYRQQSNESKEYCFIVLFIFVAANTYTFYKKKKYMITNAQLSQEVKQLRGRIRELTIGVGIESEFPPVNKIVEDYEAISSNYRLKLTSAIIKQLKSDEKLTEKFEATFLARFAHCVSFTILRLSYEFIQSYWSDQLSLLQTTFGFNKETAQRYFQTIFQEQFNASFIKLHLQGKTFVHSNLKLQLIKEHSSFRSIYETIQESEGEEKDEEDNEVKAKRNALIESCLRSMWSCVLSRPSLELYPLIFTSNARLEHEIQSKHINISKERLGKDRDCDQIGYITWPTLIRCDTNEEKTFFFFLNYINKTLSSKNSKKCERHIETFLLSFKNFH